MDCTVLEVYVNVRFVELFRPVDGKLVGPDSSLPVQVIILIRVTDAEAVPLMVVLAGVEPIGFQVVIGSILTAPVPVPVPGKAGVERDEFQPEENEPISLLTSSLGLPEKLGAGGERLLGRDAGIPVLVRVLFLEVCVTKPVETGPDPCEDGTVDAVMEEFQGAVEVKPEACGAELVDDACVEFQGVVNTNPEL